MACLNVNEALQRWMRQHGYDGLYNCDDECACDIDDLAPCCSIQLYSCELGVKTPCDCGEHDYHIDQKLEFVELCSKCYWERRENDANMTENAKRELVKQLQMEIDDQFGVIASNSAPKLYANGKVIVSICTEQREHVFTEYWTVARRR